METENSPGIAWNLSTGHGADEWTWNRCVPGQPAGASAVRVGSRREAPFDMDDRGRKKLQKPCEDSAFLGMKRGRGPADLFLDPPAVPAPSGAPSPAAASVKR